MKFLIKIETIEYKIAIFWFQLTCHYFIYFIYIKKEILSGI
jgi:hypothetical protein